MQTVSSFHWFILCRGFSFGLRVDPGFEAKSAGYLRILPQKISINFSRTYLVQQSLSLQLNHPHSLCALHRNHSELTQTGSLVDTLWFLSLFMSLTCAHLATLLQQWTRQYLMVTQPPRTVHTSEHGSAHRRKWCRKFHLPRAVETLPALLHLSLFVFFGLLIFLSNINHTPFTVVACWVGLSAGIYGCITFSHPEPRRDSGVNIWPVEKQRRLR
ncbi:hypothetical protein BGW80DRAFT_455989 [Lactifluus volemus]|nr:hypothetical protein BGW80DRAFT_455989 [Lactifluus volemus]